MSSDITDIINGVKSDSQEAFEALRQRYAPMITKQVKSFVESGAGSEGDLRDVAESALLNAAESFDVSCGVGFGYYAKICVRNALITVRRKVISAEKRNKKISSAALLKQRRRKSYGAFAGLNEEEIMKKISALLSGYEKRVFVMSLEGKSAQEIAEVVGRDEKSVNNAIFRARSKIRRTVEGQ